MLNPSLRRRIDYIKIENLVTGVEAEDLESVKIKCPNCNAEQKVNSGVLEHNAFNNGTVIYFDDFLECSNCGYKLNGKKVKDYKKLFALGILGVLLICIVVLANSLSEYALALVAAILFLAIFFRETKPSTEENEATSNK